MTIHENKQDREKQTLAAFQYERHLRSLGVTTVRLLETPEHRRECYDYEIREGESQQLWTGVLEVKCRAATDRQVQEWGSLLIEIDTLKKLKKVCATKDLQDRTRWTKNVVFLNKTRDDVCYTIEVQDLIRNWDECEDATPDMIKDDHGTESATRSGGKLVPLRLMERFI